MTTEVTNASVLAFERKLNPSDALFYAGDWNDRPNSKQWTSVSVQPKAVRGTISNRLKTKDQDAAKLDAAVENPNLQTVDNAALPAHADTLKVRFTLRVLGGAGVPSACNNDGYRQKLGGIVSNYVSQHGFTELGRRYATNLANGRFLWRNRLGAESVEVSIRHIEEGKAAQTWTFDAFEYSLRGFDQDDSDLAALGSLIAGGLSGDTHVLLEVTAFVRLGMGQEVFPSQELDMNRSRGDKSKTLYDVDKVAAMHSQKIGNAVRTVDDWYEEAESNGPIAVEPYGSVTTQGKAFRQPKAKQDFYNLLDGWVLKDKKPDTAQQHFVMATLIRGGVFGKGE